MQKLYVDLRQSTTGHEGSLSDPMSWKDLGNVFHAVSDAAFDTNSTFDQGLRFDATSLNLTVFLMGHGFILTDDNAIDAAAVRCAVGSFVKFKSYEPMTQGLATIRSSVLNGPSTTQALLTFFKAMNLHVEFDGVSFDIRNDSALSSTYTIAKMDSCITSSASFKNCLVAINGASARLAHVTNADSTSYAVVANNTFAYGSNSVGQHEISRAEGCKLSFVRNAVAQATASAAQIICATSTTSLVGGGNALASNSSTILYNAVSPSLIESDAVGLSVSRQLLWNPIIIDGNKEDHLAGIDTGMSFVRAGTFQLMHQSPAQGLGISAEQFTSVDAFGFDRVAGRVDAGALQKTALTQNIDLHVDLELTGYTQNNGSESSPISLTDWTTDYARRAPVDCAFKYILRGSNAAPVHSFDLGPVSLNTTAQNTRYAGAGSMTIESYKPYRKQLSTLTVRKLIANAETSVKLRSVLIKHVGGNTPSLIEATVSSTGSLELLNCGVYSDATAVGMIASMPLNAASLRLFGCSLSPEHANGLTNGLFSAMNSKINIELCMVKSMNTTTLGNGGSVKIAGSYFYSNGSAMSWSGASVDAYTELNGQDQPFADSASGDFAPLGSCGLEIIPNYLTLSLEGFKSLSIDAKELERTSNVDKSYDAGMYETGVRVPPQKDYYVDLAKTKPGMGILASKWSVADLKEWLNSNPFVDRKTVVHFSRTGKMTAEIPNIDFNVNGSIDFTSENKNAPSLVYAKDFSVLYGPDAEIPVSFNGLMIGSENCSSLVNLPKCSVSSVNSIWSIIRDSAVICAEMLSQPPLTSTVSIVAGGKSVQLIEGQHWEVGSTLRVSVTNLCAAIVAAGIEAMCYSTKIEVKEAVSFSSSSASSYNVTEASSGIVSKKFAGFGSSFVDANSALSIETSFVECDDFYAECSAFSGSSLTKYVALASNSAVLNKCIAYSVDSASNIATAVINIALSPVFQSAYVELPDYVNFKLANAAAEHIMLESESLGHTSDVKVDMLGRLRSQAFSGGQASYDAGAIETNFLEASKAFDQSADDALSYITDAGIHLNARAKSGHIVFKVSGYVVGTGGYVFWDPTLVDRTNLDDGSQSRGLITVTANAGWSTETVTVLTPLGTVVVRYAADFSSGSTVEETASNIADALRANEVFNKACWARVTNNTVEVFTWLYGTDAVGYAVSVSGSNLSRTQFVQGQNQKATTGLSWPSIGAADWFKTEKPDARSLSFCARLGENDAIGPIGEMAVMATVVQSPFASEVGKQYVYGRVKTPLRVKTSTEIMTRRFIMCF